MRRHPALVTAIAIGSCTVLSVSACGTAGTQVRPTNPTGQVAVTCQAFRAALPSTIAGQTARPVLPPSPYTAAWGKPPVTSRCGVETPMGLEPTSQLFTIDGIDWFPAMGTDATTFTTIGRVASIEVSVPKSLAPEASVLTDFSDAVKKSNPLTPSR